MNSIDFCFVWMPFSTLYTPSLGIALLQSSLRRGGVSTYVYYANLELASMGIINDQELVFFINSHSGEWLFSEAAFGKFIDNQMPYLLRVCHSYKINPVKAIPRLKEIREQMKGYIDHVAEKIVALNPKIVSPSSIFFQHIASLAVLRRIKELRSDIVTVMGGSNCELPMGMATHKFFPWVDYVVVGEADNTILPFAELALKYNNTIPLAKLPAGVLAPQHRDTGYPDAGWRSITEDMNLVPEPDYADYYREIAKYGLKIKDKVALLAESSRGCWWAANNHGCNFCSLLSAQDRYRVKKSALVLQQLEEMNSRYQPRSIEFTDRVIPEQHYKDFLPVLADKGGPYPLFYEARVNGFTRKRAELLRRAGVKKLQLGIESLSDRILGLMNKGARLWENIQALKFTICEGIEPFWNMLYAIPGEAAEDYSEAFALLKKIVHFTPAKGFIKLQYRRRSTFTTEHNSLVCHQRYKYLYPIPENELDNIAYVFEPSDDIDVLQCFEAIPSADIKEFILMTNGIKLWSKIRRLKKRVCLSAFSVGDVLQVVDTRPEFIKIKEDEYDINEQFVEYSFSGAEKDVLRCCDKAPLVSEVLCKWPEQGQEILDSFVAKSLVVISAGRVIGISLLNPYGDSYESLMAELSAQKS